jgi:hypothetical protein
VQNVLAIAKRPSSLWDNGSMQNHRMPIHDHQRDADIYAHLPLLSLQKLQTSRLAAMSHQCEALRNQGHIADLILPGMQHGTKLCTLAELEDGILKEVELMPEELAVLEPEEVAVLEASRLSSQMDRMASMQNHQRPTPGHLKDANKYVHLHLEVLQKLRRPHSDIISHQFELLHSPALGADPIHRDKQHDKMSVVLVVRH